MKKKIVLLAMIFLFGCTSFQIPSLPTSKQDITLAETHTGSDGVVVSFVAGTPPGDVFEKQLFSIGFTLENKGAIDVKEGIYVVSIPDDLLTFDETFGKFSLKGRTTFNPMGDSKNIVLKTRARELISKVERLPSKIGVDICYPYKTQLNAMVCINPELGVLTKPTQICSPIVQTFSGQGAPVVVTQIDALAILPSENPRMIVPQIVLHVQNLGKGTVVAKSRIVDACAGRSLSGAYNVVSIGGSLSDIPLDCVPSELTLSEGDNQIVCTASSGLEKARGSHNALLNINLDYGYTIKTNKQIYIKQSLG